MLSSEYIVEKVRAELEEDIGSGDATTLSVLPTGMIAKGAIIAKEMGIVAGIDFARAAFMETASDTVFENIIADREIVRAGDIVASITGNAIAVLSAERTALNFLCHLSGIATLTRRFVNAVAGTETKILDTRKTIPGLRPAEKYAVVCGGGENHRMGLHDMILIKDNHIAAAGGVEIVLGKLYGEGAPALPVEIEVINIKQLEIALKYPIDRIMLDNFTVGLVIEAVTFRERMGAIVPFECSGGITLDNVREYAEAGAEYVSSGALTHSAPQLDISLEVKMKNSG